MATKFSALDIKKEGAQFVTKVLGDADFVKFGYLYGNKPDPIYWAAIDGARHPLHVWPKQGVNDYPESAKKLDSAAFSNGPMMANPSMSAPIPPSLGPVHGVHHKVDDNGAGNVDPWLYLFGRKTAAAGGVVSSDYVIANNSSITGYDEVITALIPLIVNRQPLSVNEMKGGAKDPLFNPGYRDLILGQGGNPGNKRVSAWAIVTGPAPKPVIVKPVGPAPVPPGHGNDDPPPTSAKEGGAPAAAATTGIILAIGTLWDGHIKEIVAILQGIGTVNAVAMDGSTSAMLGEHANSWYTPEGAAGVVKNIWQKYGFCCGGK